MPGSYCRGYVDTACRLECCFYRVELLEACLCRVECLECCREPGAGSLIAGFCRVECLETQGTVAGRCLVLVCTGWHGMSLVVVVFLVEELILYLELLDCVWRHCSSCRNVEIPLYTKIDWRISPWIFSLLFFGNNSVHRIIVLVWMTGCMLEACGFDHMFSLLKRCKYSLYSDTMLHFGSTNPCRIHARSF